jgi:hypothetical protein
LLILFWPLALLIAIGWLALLIVRLGFGLTVLQSGLSVSVAPWLRRRCSATIAQPMTATL